ncbi:hypothetical protein LINPERHAP2_LOCUS416, partial [Linum perenne]
LGHIPTLLEGVPGFYKPWSKALVVKVLEKTFAFGTVKCKLESLWARKGPIIVSDVANAFFLVRFSDPDDYRRAAFEGPWKIFDYYFSVANEEEPIKSILTWVRLPKLPIHYFNRLVVTRIENCIGKTVRLDLATEKGARARYARVCVEVDLSKLLLGKTYASIVIFMDISLTRVRPQKRIWKRNFADGRGKCSRPSSNQCGSWGLDDRDT